MALHRSMPREARERLAPGSRWIIDGAVYTIEKITAVRAQTFWEDGVNYVPVSPKEDAPNDYTRVWDDFIRRASPEPDEPASDDRGRTCA